MFRTMRRSAQALTEKECEEVLRRGQEGVLALTGDEGWPYAVPVNYLYDEGKIYIHGAREGHRADAVRKEPRVSFCVMDERTVVPAAYSTAYRSVIVFGRARYLEDLAEIRERLDRLAAKFVPDGPEKRQAYIDHYIAETAVLEIEICHMTGKEGRLLREKKEKLAGQRPPVIQ